jgi:hypothetical protein
MTGEGMITEGVRRGRQRGEERRTWGTYSASNENALFRPALKIILSQKSGVAALPGSLE